MEEQILSMHLLVAFWNLWSILFAPKESCQTSEPGEKLPKITPKPVGISPPGGLVDWLVGATVWGLSELGFLLIRMSSSWRWLDGKSHLAKCWGCWSVTSWFDMRPFFWNPLISSRKIEIFNLYLMENHPQVWPFASSHLHICSRNVQCIGAPARQSKSETSGWVIVAAGFRLSPVWPSQEVRKNTWHVDINTMKPCHEHTECVWREK